ncbi:MAG TPA: hypothetical protein VF613_20590 [Longimicrobium sp.]|jgi:hypothetical protein
MRYLLLWPPLLWALRLLLLVYAGGILYISSLYLARFLRPRNAWMLLSGGLPSLTRVEGTAKVMGQELTLNAEVDKRRDQQLSRIDQRLEELERYVTTLRRGVGPLLDEPDTSEEPHG